MWFLENEIKEKFNKKKENQILVCLLLAYTSYGNSEQVRETIYRDEGSFAHRL